MIEKNEHPIKPLGVKIIQFQPFAMAAQSTMGQPQVGIQIVGLGDDSRPYLWNGAKENWLLIK